eukprot:TRINITY_DN2790_c0_g1_i2.p1 TRINITY_DN2790_c0_g1~~TRINITY_DN2790_c0_g1_i2.p1  ORF type:complete len:460 (+),score=162.14 TRINITY_DN2790_c0_g1_i2:1153-2532(+)
MSDEQIAVEESRIDEELQELDNDLSAELKERMNEEKRIIRVYVYRGTGMTRKQIMYPVVTTGDWDPKHTASGVQHRTETKTSKPAFYECYEVQAFLPGDADLKIQIYQYNVVFADELIGETTVDLEARYYNQSWLNVDLKPREFRSLWSPSSQLPQGKIECRIEILTPEQARSTPIENIKPPPPKPFQLRLIVWNVLNAEYPIDATKGDFMVSAQFGDQKTRELLETDVHWNSDDHEGRFNWRMKIDADLPLQEPEPNRVLLQLWDRGMLSPNDALAEVNLNLKGWLKKAAKVIEDKTHPAEMPGGDKYALCQPKATRLNMTHPVHKDPIIRAQIEFSMYVMTKAQSKRLDAGMGRDEPNQHPFLEEPPRPPKPWDMTGKFGNFWADNKALIIAILVLGLLGAIFFTIVMPIIQGASLLDTVSGGGGGSPTPTPNGGGGGGSSPAPSGGPQPPPPPNMM